MGIPSDESRPAVESRRDRAIDDSRCYSCARSSGSASHRPALSFSELDHTIRQIGDDLHAAGISGTSRVGIVLPNGPEAAAVATTFAGVVANELQIIISNHGVDETGPSVELASALHTGKRNKNFVS